MSSQRDLDWDGCYNVRDLGGLPTNDGRTTRWGALVRADAPSGLTESGWRAARDHGVTTIVDLMETHGAVRRGRSPGRPDRRSDVPIDGTDDDGLPGTGAGERALGPLLYYGPIRAASRIGIAAAVRAFAGAPAAPYCCIAGAADRTGLVSMVAVAGRRGSRGHRR